MFGGPTETYPPDFESPKESDIPEGEQMTGSTSAKDPSELLVDREAETKVGRELQEKKVELPIRVEGGIIKL